MNLRAVFHAQGHLLTFLGAVMLAPALIGLGYTLTAADPAYRRLGNAEAWGFLTAIVIAVSAGQVMVRICRPKDPAAGHRLGSSEGFGIVTLGWLSLCGFSALPFFFYGVLSASPATPVPGQEFASFTNSYFETMSGYTTTGATILTEIERVPRGLLFWRSLTHWLGGMGIILLSVAILPALGAGGAQLFRAEVSGITKERLRPRIVETAKTLWLLYFALSAAEFVLLCVFDPTPRISFADRLFDSACHTFGTMATGGFSTKNASIGHYAQMAARGEVSPVGALAYELTVVVFMFLAGCSFVLLFAAGRGRSLKSFWRSEEFRFYAKVLLGATLFMAVVLYVSGDQADHREPGVAMRVALFQAVSINTTTGYCTADFDRWPDVCRLLLVVLMLFGGCAGSTAGGIKQIRILLLFKQAWLQVKSLLFSRAVMRVKIDETAVDHRVLEGVVGFFALYLAIIVIVSVLVALLLDAHAVYPHNPEDQAWLRDTRGQVAANGGGREKERLIQFQRTLEDHWTNYSAVTAFTATTASISNIGPGLAGVGATRNYHALPAGVKWILVGCMLIGRLEVFSVIVLLSRAMWRK